MFEANDPRSSVAPLPRAPQPGGDDQGALVRLLDGLTFAPRTVGQQHVYVCHHHQKGQFFHFGPEEYQAAMLLDGARRIEDVASQLTRQGLQWTAADVARLSAMLVHNGLARVVHNRSQLNAAAQRRVGDPQPGPPRKPGGTGGAGGTEGAGVWQLVRYLSPVLSQRINLFDGDPLAARLVGWLGPCFSLRGVAVWLVLVASGMGIVASQRGEFAAELQRLFQPSSWPLLVVVWCLVKIAHEVGHAVAARRQGVRVGRAGIILFLMAPLVFIDVTDAWRLRRRWSRIQIALAGMYVELAIASLAGWVWWSAERGFARHLAAQVFVLAGPATLLVNANPLLRLDGYYILADVLDIPNLRMHGRQCLLARVESWLGGRSQPPSLLSGWRVSAATVHAVCSILFQFVWMSGLIISVSLWAGGFGVVLGVIAAVLWFVLPVAQWVAQLRRGESWSLVRHRLILLVALGAVVVGLLASFPSPLSRRVPVVVQYRDEQVARAATEGFVTAVLVRTGQRVEAGDVLVVMDDPELRVRREHLALNAEAARLRARRLNREGQTALASAEEERHEGLLRSLKELEAQVESLTIRARRDGVICSRKPERWVGRFARRGDVLLSVGEETAKEVLASIGGADLEAYLRAVVRQQPCQVRLRGGQRFELVPASPRPRVRQTIPHPALAATAGGPLPVEPHSQTASNDGLRLIDSRSASRSPLRREVSANLRAGQQGMLSIGDSRSLVTRLLDLL